MPDQATCSIPDCNRPRTYRLYCRMHYKRWARHADPLWEPASEASRFWGRVEKTPTCWLWLGGLNRTGYGCFSAEGRRKVLAHRWAYEHLVGKIPDRLVIDHLCRVPRCVSPMHLEPVTDAENMRRGFSIPALNGRKTHCKYGHEFTPENTGRPSRGGRVCKTCKAAYPR